MTEVTLIGKKGEKKVSIEKAERILRYKSVNPSQTWELKEGKYIFDGKNVVKKPQTKKDKEEGSEN